MIMKKQSNSFWFKAVNFVICGLAIVGCIAGIAGMMIYGIMPEKSEVIDTVYENVAGNYSAQLVGKVISGETDELDYCEKTTSMRYAIIKTDISDFEKVNTQRNSLYVYGDKSALDNYKYVQRYIDDGSGSIPSFNLVNSLAAMEYTNDDNYRVHDEYFYKATITQIAMDLENAQFCVFAGDSVYLPTKAVVGKTDGTQETFVLSENKYINFYTGDELKSGVMEEWVDSASISWVDVYSSDDSFTEAYYYSGTSSSVNELAVYPVIYLEKVPFPEDYQINGENIDARQKNTNFTYYYVLSWVNTSFPNGEDYFFQAQYWVNLACNMGKFAWVIEIVSVVLLLITSFFLFKSVGKRPVYIRNDEKDLENIDEIVRERANQIHLRWVDKIPFSILTFAVICIEGIFVALAISPAEIGIRNYYQFLLIVFEAVMAGIYLGMYYLASIITRFKAHVFMRYTLWYYITKPFKKMKSNIKERITQATKDAPLFRKVVIIFVGVFIIELVTIIMAVAVSGAYTPIPAVFWLILIKAVEFGTIVMALMQFNEIEKGTEEIVNGNTSYKIDTEKMYLDLKKHGENINSISDGISLAVEERMKSERMKTELITNVSHDIKTPLTSIINYVDLIKKEDIKDEKMSEYVEVLDRQSVRLKKLLEDLLEASKASTGNLEVNMEKMDVAILLNQLVGEYTERLENRKLSLVMDTHGFEQVYIMADGRHIWRVFDNLLNNICKYAMEGTRVYIDITSLNTRRAAANKSDDVNVEAYTEYPNTYESDEQEPVHVNIVFKNISASQLNISSDELMERFVRGDSSRNTEGSGLGLSIAQSLMKIMGGDMKLEVDGDLFKVVLTI